MRRDIDINSDALKLRKVFGEDAYSPLDIFASVNAWKEKKITIIYYPLSSRISGMCTRVNQNILICINSGTSLGRQRFTLAHELYHILFENELKNIICEMKMNGDKSDSEKEADMFASYLLMPYDALKQYKEKISVWTIEEIISAEQFFQISHNAMLLRLYNEQYISKEEFEKYLTIGVTKEAIRLGYSANLYEKSPENKQYFATGEYIRMVEEISEKEMVSSGKREELLLDAFRADIVYGLNEVGMDIYE
ncbi:MAG: ImmA/IrrE family metallo-endopeptidase [Lachnospiraceae bacterium]